jgi:hypothetical protein
MSTNLSSEVKNLRQRVERLERHSRKTTRGSVGLTKAAAYLGKSREWLRLRNARGEGPQRNPDGSYSYDSLDLYQESGAA